MSPGTIADTLVRLIAGYTFMPHAHTDDVSTAPMPDMANQIVRRFLL